MIFTNIYMALWGIVGLLAWLVGFFHIFKKGEVYIPKKYMSNSPSPLRFFLMLLGVIAWLLISFSMMGPKEPIGSAKNKIEVNDIFFVVDVSLSMSADDFLPNRLEAAKEKILDFVKLRPTDRIGIIMFSEKAYTLLPLTIDLELVKQIIREIRMGGGLGSGTNIGDALGLAVARGAQSLADNKTIILLTDGVSNVGTMTPRQAAEEAKKNKMKVYTIGIGRSRDAKMRAGRAGRAGRGRRGSRRIPGGSFDLKTLEEIAQITGGESFIAQNGEALKDVLLEIEKLERTEIEASSRVLYKELYFKYLFLGGLLLILVELSRLYLFKEGEV